LYEEMQSNVRDKVTDIIMRGRLTPQAISQEAATQMRERKPGEQVPDEAAADINRARDAQAQARAQAQAAAAGQAQRQPAARPAAAAPATATLRRATAGGGAGAKPTGGATGKTAIPAIGRNEVVTVINPQTGKQEQMKFKKAKPLLEQGWKLG
jgi:hypothetical protein